MHLRYLEFILESSLGIENWMEIYFTTNLNSNFFNILMTWDG